MHALDTKKYIPSLTDANAYQAFQLLRIGTVLATGILLVKAGLDKQAVSRFELFLFWSNILSFFWVMGIKNAAISYYPTLSPIKQKIFFFNVFVLFQTLGILLFLFIFAINFFQKSDTLAISQFRSFLPVYILIYAPTVLIELIFILKKEAKKMLQYGIFIHLLQFSLVAFSLLISKDTKFLFLALVCWVVVKWFYTFILVIKYSHWQYSGVMLKAFGLFSLPLVAHILLGNGMEYIDGILVNRFFDSGQFAVYRFGARELPVFLVMIGALSSVLIPIGVSNINDAASRIKQETRKLMHLFFPLILLLLFISPALYSFFYSSEYRSSAFIFNIYLLIFASRIIMVEVFMYAKHQNKMLMWFSGLELVINLFASLLLMRWFGMEGIAWGTVVAFAISKILFIVFIYRKFHLSISAYLELKTYIIYSLTLYACHFLSWYLWTR